MENTSLTTSLKNVRIYEATKETGENGCHQQQEEEQQHQQHDQQQQLQQQQQQHGQQQQQPQQEQQTQLQPQDASSSNLDHTRKKKQWLLKRKKKLSRRQSSEGAFIHITGTGTILEDTVGFSQRNREKNESFSEADEFPRGVGQYENFHTIDWQRDLARSKYRRRYLDRKMNTGFCGLLKGHFDACSGWICVFLVGVAAGSIAAAIDIGEGWLNDLKEGVCPQAFWLNKEQCCWSSNSTFYDGNKCDQWSDWVEFMGKEHSDNAEYAICYTVYVLWSLFFGALASCMVRALSPYACGSGIPEIKTILSGFIMRGYLGKMTLLVKSVTIMLSVASGLVLGKEGPLVHVVCCIGNVLAYLFPKYGKNEAKKREVLSAAAAAGVSVAFNAPIGGVLFSLEEVSYYFPMKTLWRSFFCALVAAFVLRSINPFGTDHPVKYYMNATRAWMLPELLPFLFLGVLGGIIGTAFIWCNTAWCKIRKTTRLGKFPITEVLTVTLVTAMIAYPNEFTRMNTSDLIRILFSECGIHDSSPLCDYKRNVTSLEKHMHVIAMGPGIHKSLYLLLQALVTTWVLTIFTFGMKVPAGLFVPSMAMGAIMGRIIGIGVQQLTITYHNSWFVKSMCTSNDDCLSPGLYAMIGAAATLAGVTRMTVSLVVIMFELTGSVDYIVPLMATLMVSKWVGEALGIEGIYDSHIHLNRYPFLNKKEAFRHSTVARDLTRLVRKDRDEMQCLPREGMTVNDVEEIMKRTSHIGFPVVLSKENPYLFGYVLRRDLNLAIEHLKNTKEEISEESPVYFTEKPPVVRPKLAPILLSRIVDKAPITVTVQTPMDTVIDMFCKLGLRQILVTDNGGLVDIITKKDVLNHMEEMSKPKRTRAAGIEL